MTHFSQETMSEFNIKLSLRGPSSPAVGKSTQLAQTNVDQMIGNIPTTG